MHDSSPKRKSILSKLDFLRMNITARVRRVYFTFQVSLYNGKQLMAESDRFEHPVRFQGSGNLEFEEKFIFGYWLAGAIRDPIQIQS